MGVGNGPPSPPPPSAAEEPCRWHSTKKSLPSQISCPNGGAHEILHLECVAITKSKVVIPYPEEDRVVRCSLIHVNAVELLQRG